MFSDPAPGVIEVHERDRDGEVRTYRFSDGLVIDAWSCPKGILYRDHYRADGTCVCPDSEK